MSQAIKKNKSQLQNGTPSAYNKPKPGNVGFGALVVDAGKVNENETVETASAAAFVVTIGSVVTVAAVVAAAIGLPNNEGTVVVVVAAVVTGVSVILISAAVTAALEVVAIAAAVVAGLEISGFVSVSMATSSSGLVGLISGVITSWVEVDLPNTPPKLVVFDGSGLMTIAPAVLGATCEKA